MRECLWHVMCGYVCVCVCVLDSERSRLFASRAVAVVV